MAKTEQDMREASPKAPGKGVSLLGLAEMTPSDKEAFLELEAKLEAPFQPSIPGNFHTNTDEFNAAVEELFTQEASSGITPKTKFLVEDDREAETHLQSLKSDDTALFRDVEARHYPAVPLPGKKEDTIIEKRKVKEKRVRKMLTRKKSIKSESEFEELIKKKQEKASQIVDAEDKQDEAVKQQDSIFSSVTGGILQMYRDRRMGKIERTSEIGSDGKRVQIDRKGIDMKALSKIVKEADDSFRNRWNIPSSTLESSLRVVDGSTIVGDKEEKKKKEILRADIPTVRTKQVQPGNLRRSLFAAATAMATLVPGKVDAYLNGSDSSSKKPGSITSGLPFETQSVPEGQDAEQKPFEQEVGKILYPPYLGEKNELGYYQMPGSPLWEFLQKGQAEVFDNDEACQAQRWASRELIGGIYTVAKAWNTKFPDSKLIVGDLNASGHASHKVGNDVDIYMGDKSINVGTAQFNRVRSTELGIMLIKTGFTDLIFYNDKDVIKAVNDYARANNLSGEMQYEDNHDNHMHWRIKHEPGPENTPSCEGEVPKIEIPWMPREVRRWDNLILEKAKKYGVDPELVSIIVYKESAGDPNAGSTAGARGLIQVMPGTAAGIATELGIKKYDLSDPDTNLEFGVYYLSQRLKQFGLAEHAPSWDRAVLLAAVGYNGGPRAGEHFRDGTFHDEYGPFCESREYGYYVVGMWRERHEQTSKHFDELNQIGHRCNTDAKSYISYPG